MTSRKFSIKSVYLELTKRDVGPSYNEIWKAKILENVKKFMWQWLKTLFSLKTI
jgi:hypothetical protein